MLTVPQLKKALQLAEKIEEMEGELKKIINGYEADRPLPANLKHREPGVALGAGLSHSVREVLVTAGKPMRVGEIVETLRANGYVFKSKNPERSLGAQIYSLRGVKRAGRGLFKASKA